ncbi:benzoate/H(+) symporter BenE family transporter [Aeromicrobium chenweiae]|uniref:Benzoate transporter n=1 Tax=Aeromicrobium chenweiae TaxID=2079793 RepID=A0A2S0WJV3_9ACTN|nr:benzoate/H(+) symporter BenE family transporter [Aeromicrobium chenweiae]AWB91611.1 benzoate transporter [Aeromicrobium chenweiae]TGN32448.1 benzoate/H(+) symporter BenE family transporter [Aeromicrobium chenweiae]
MKRARTTTGGDLQQPISAGVVAALVGYTSSFAVVLTGLHAVGATPAQAASGLLALCLTQAIGMFWLSARYRMPLILVWSTPGVALLAGTEALDGGWPVAVGAFLVAGAAYVVTGLWPALGRLISRIPAPIAQAMLAGVVLELCLQPVTALRDNPGAILPIALVWLLGVRFAPRWAVPAAFLAAGVVIGADMVRHGTSIPGSSLLPELSFTTPAWSWAAMIGIAVPLYVVTMASQNVPGVAIMKSLGYDVPWRGSVVTAGVATMVGAPAGGHSVNLAAISAALAAGPPAGPDPRRRWIAAQAAASTYVVLAVASAALAALVAVAPAGVIATVAGLALLGTLADALEGALSDRSGREAAVITFLVAASGVSALGIGSAFWALVAGLVVHLVLHRRPH